jgi:hypothetical protein
MRGHYTRAAKQGKHFSENEVQLFCSERVILWGEGMAEHQQAGVSPYFFRASGKKQVKHVCESVLLKREQQASLHAGFGHMTLLAKSSNPVYFLDRYVNCADSFLRNGTLSKSGGFYVSMQAYKEKHHCFYHHYTGPGKKLLCSGNDPGRICKRAG